MKAVKDFTHKGIAVKAGQDVAGLWEADELPTLAARGMIAYDRPPEPEDGADKIVPVRPPRRAK